MVTKHRILSAWYVDIPAGGAQEYHIKLGSKKVLQKDLDFIIIQLLYNSVKKYVLLQGEQVNRETFTKATAEYIGNDGAVAVHVNALYDLRHPSEVPKYDNDDNSLRR